MEKQVILLGADGHPVGDLGKLRSRNSILLGEANGDYMNCTRESVEELQRQKANQLCEYRKKHGCECIASDLMPIRLASFENPYDELHNLLLQAYNNTTVANSLLREVSQQRREINLLYQKLDREHIARELAAEFIQSSGRIEEFRRFCEERTAGPISGNAVRYEVKPLIK